MKNVFFYSLKLFFETLIRNIFPSKNLWVDLVTVLSQAFPLNKAKSLFCLSSRHCLVWFECVVRRDYSKRELKEQRHLPIWSNQTLNCRESPASPTTSLPCLPIISSTPAQWVPSLTLKGYVLFLFSRSQEGPLERLFFFFLLFTILNLWNKPF